MTVSKLPLGSGVATLNPLAAAFPGLVGSIVSAPTPLAAVQRALWREVDSLWSGTQGMRLAGTTFLPMQPGETKENYQRRLARSTLLNYYKSAIQAAVAKVFAQDVVVDNPPVQTTLILDDVDSQGQNLTQFARDSLADAINHGVSFILVDHTRVPEDFANLAEQQQSGVRPYWVNIPATKVLDARSADFGGSQRLSYFRYEEEVWEPSADGFSGAQFRQVRIFQQLPGEPVMFAVYREVDGQQWQLQDSGILTIDAIPIVPIYTCRMGFFMGKPPLQDLADINLQHWQCNSDYQNSVHVATVPFLFTKGLKPQMDASGNVGEINIDVSSGITATDPNATVEWVEVSGAALSAARANLDALCAEMEKLGGTLCAQQPGNVTATQTSINASEANAVTKAWALALQDALNGALWFTAAYLGEPAITATVNTDFASDYSDDASMVYVLDAFTAGVIDKDTVISEGKRRAIFDPMTDITAAVDAPVVAPTVVNNSLTPTNT